MTDEAHNVKTASVQHRGNDHALRAPYTFVPINDRVLTVADPSHRRPEPDGLSGKLTVEFSNETPFLVGGANGDNDAPFRIDNQLMVPGASLRGLLRSVVEIAGFGRVNFTDPHPAAIRDFRAATWRERTRDMSMDRQVAWLFRTTRRNGTQVVHDYTLVHADKTEPVDIAHVAGLCGTTIDDWHAMSLHERLEALDAAKLMGLKPASAFNIPHLPNQDAQLVIAGATTPSDRPGRTDDPKNREYLALYPSAPREHMIDTGVAENFLNSLARDPNRHSGPPQCNISALENTGPLKKFGLGPLADQLKDPAAHGVPVFYAKAQGGAPPVLSLTAFYRVAYANNMQDALKRTQPDSKQDPARLDLAEALFGWAPPQVKEANPHLRAAHDKAWRGRVKVGFATHIGGSGRTRTETLPGLKPRPSFHPFYLRASSEGAPHPLDLDNPKSIVAGRKRYPVRGTATTERPVVSADQTNSPAFLENGQTFRAEIRLHNARPEEVGALIWAITLGQLPETGAADGSPLPDPVDQGLRHSLGRGRNFGFGQIRMRLAKARLTPVLGGDSPTPQALVTAFKTWVSAGLQAAGEAVSAFDDREEIQRFLGTCHLVTGAALERQLRYTGYRAGASDSQSILDAHTGIKAASMHQRNRPAPSSLDPAKAGFIGLPPWPRYDWRRGN